MGRIRASGDHQAGLIGFDMMCGVRLRGTQVCHLGRALRRGNGTSVTRNTKG